MRIYIISLILSICCSILWAQSPLDITDSGQQEPLPETLASHIAAGYDFMQDGKPLMAQREYRQALELDATSLEAWQGVMWSGNGLKQWKLTTKSAKTAMQLFPYDANLQYMTAYAYWNQYNALKAHQLYLNGRDLAAEKMDKTGQIASLEGLGWIYNSFGNYPRAKHAFIQAQNMYPENLVTPGLKAISGVQHNTILAYSRLSKQKTDIALKQYCNFRALELGAGFEQYRKDNTRYRDVLTAELSYQFAPVKVTATGFKLTGDSYLYPAYTGHLELSHQYWLSETMLEPAYRYAFSYYPDFNVYQNDLNLNFYWQKLNATATLINIQRDVLSPGGDYLDWMLHATVGYPVYKGTKCYLTAGTGKQDWWIIPGGYAVDDYKTVNMYYGNSWQIPVNSKMDIYFRQQLGKRDDKWSYSNSFALGFKYANLKQ